MQYLGIEIFIITAPHTALCLLWHISPAIEVLEALSLCKGPYPLPGSRAGIPEIGGIAQLLHLGRYGRNIWLLKGLRHGGEIKIGICQACGHTGHGGNGAGSIRQHGIAIICILSCNNPFHAIGNVQLAVFVQKRPVGIAFGYNQENLLGLGHLGTLSLPTKIIIQIIAIRTTASQLSCQLLNLLCGKIQAIAGQHTVIHAIAPIYGLIIVQDSFVHKAILGNTYIFPFQGCFPAPAAPKDNQSPQHIKHQGHNRPLGNAFATGGLGI